MYTGTAILKNKPVAEAPASAFLIDEVGQDAMVAYSTRKLRAGYTGDCVEVRRSSDNATTDIGFDGNGDIDSTSLLSFVGSNLGTVVTWYDQSGNGYDATSGGSGVEPIIASGSAMIYDDGPGNAAVLQSNQDRWMNTATFPSIYKPEISGYTEILSYNSIGMFHAELNNGYALGMYNGIVDGIGTYGSAGSAPREFAWLDIETNTSGDPFVWSVWYDRGGSNAKAWGWSNLANITTNQITFDLDNGVYAAPTCNNMTLFRYPAGGLFAACRIGEWMIWDVGETGLSDSERDTLQNNQGDYWGIIVNNTI